MFAHSPYLVSYLLNALDATPLLIAEYFEGLSDAKADKRPDPKRFTMREVICHLADFEPIFRGRMERMASEELPKLENRDEGQIAIENDYAHADVEEQTGIYLRERAKTVAFLTQLPAEHWSREGVRENVGNVTIEDIAHLLVVHDIYHLKQLSDYTKSP